ncbi:MAG: C40 family peptidase [Bryobacterales bacterium]|nr:C40 family peptidase [Bryobacterales bacterium]
MIFLAAMTLLAAAAGAVVTRPVANLHSRPSEDADVVSQAILGSNVEVLEQTGAWRRVRTADRYSGWISSDALRPLRKGEPAYASAGRVAGVESLFANLYREPDATRHQPLMTAPFESRLEVASEPEAEDRRWLQLRLPDGRPAWVQRGDVSFRLEPLDAGGVIALARRFLGIPYLWGGASSFGYDCSGFTQMLMRRRGAAPPRDASPQANWEGLAPVGRDALRAGDFLFFGASRDKITHSGMYIGGGEFIHATTWLKPAVQISSLDDPHWSGLLVACRRLK